MAASATFALKAGVWFRRGRRCMVSPDSLGTACPPSGRNSTYRPVQILEAGSYRELDDAIGLTVIASDGQCTHWQEWPAPVGRVVPAIGIWSRTKRLRHD